MKTKFLKHCSIKNLLIVLCVLILLYLIYDTYVVRENFEMSAFDIFGSSDLTNAVGDDGVAAELDDFCEKIQQLYALCTRCESDDQKFNDDKKMCDWDRTKWGFSLDETDKQYIYTGTGVADFTTEVSGNFLTKSNEIYLRCGADYEASGNIIADNKLKCDKGIIGINSKFGCNPKSCNVSDDLSNNFVYAYNGKEIEQDIKHNWFTKNDPRLRVKCKHAPAFYSEEQYTDSYMLLKEDCPAGGDYSSSIDKCNLKEMTIDLNGTEASVLGMDEDGNSIFSEEGYTFIKDYFANIDTTHELLDRAQRYSSTGMMLAHINTKFHPTIKKFNPSSEQATNKIVLDESTITKDDDGVSYITFTLKPV